MVLGAHGSFPERIKMMPWWSVWQAPNGDDQFARSENKNHLPSEKLPKKNTTSKPFFVKKNRGPHLLIVFFFFFWGGGCVVNFIMCLAANRSCYASGFFGIPLSSKKYKLGPFRWQNPDPGSFPEFFSRRIASIQKSGEYKNESFLSSKNRSSLEKLSNLKVEVSKMFFFNRPWQKPAKRVLVGDGPWHFLICLSCTWAAGEIFAGRIWWRGLQWVFTDGAKSYPSVPWKNWTVWKASQEELDYETPIE